LTDERKSKKSKYSEDIDPGCTEDSLDVPDVDVAIPVSASKQVEEEVAGEDEFGCQDLRAILSLKADHSREPLWVVSTLLVLLGIPSFLVRYRMLLQVGFLP